MTAPAPTVSEQTERLDGLSRLGYRSLHGAVRSERPPPGHYLTVEDGLQTRLLGLEREVTHVGRGFSCEVCLEDQSVSRRHAVITRAGAQVEILDDRSSNGVYVNGRRVSAAVLRDGDVIALGRVILGYLEVPGPGGA